MICLHNENHRIPKKKLKWTSENGMISFLGRMGRNNVKMIISRETIQRVNAISIEIPITFFTELAKKNPKIYIETLKTPK